MYRSKHSCFRCLPFPFLQEVSFLVEDSWSTINVDRFPSPSWNYLEVSPWGVETVKPVSIFLILFLCSQFLIEMRPIRYITILPFYYVVSTLSSYLFSNLSSRPDYTRSRVESQFQRFSIILCCSKILDSTQMPSAAHPFCLYLYPSFRHSNSIYQSDVISAFLYVHAMNH